jgi:hypothetical protein
MFPSHYHHHQVALGTIEKGDVEDIVFLRQDRSTVIYPGAADTIPQQWCMSHVAGHSDKPKACVRDGSSS